MGAECSLEELERLADLVRKHDLYVLADEAYFDMRYEGTSSVDDRPTLVLVRQLPPDGQFPNARLVLHLDQEWLIPVFVETFADHDERRLIGRYHYSNIELNPGLSDNVFRF